MDSIDLSFRIIDDEEIVFDNEGERYSDNDCNVQFDRILTFVDLCNDEDDDDNDEIISWFTSDKTLLDLSFEFERIHWNYRFCFFVVTNILFTKKYRLIEDFSYIKLIKKSVQYILLRVYSLTDVYAEKKRKEKLLVYRLHWNKHFIYVSHMFMLKLPHAMICGKVRRRWNIDTRRWTYYIKERYVPKVNLVFV